MSIHKNKDNILFWLLVIVLSIVTARHNYIFHQHNMTLLENASRSVVFGNPEWIAFQNRLLGPYIIEFINDVFFSNYSKSFKIFFELTIYCEFILLAIFLLKLTSNSYELVLKYLMCFALFFSFLQNYWYYVWDSLDLIIFTIFGYFILYKKNIYHFISLFIISIMNREIGCIIAIYMILNAINWNNYKHILSLASLNKWFFTGLFLLLTGIIYTKFIRDNYVLIIGMDIINNDQHKIIGNHFYLFDNLVLFFKNFFMTKGIEISLLISSIIYYFVFSFKDAKDEQKDIIIIVAILLLSIFTFGVLNESRLYIILLPMIILLHASLSSTSVIRRFS